MSPIVELRGEALGVFLDSMQELAAGDWPPYVLRFAFDEGLKVKVNEHTWSPPMGEVTG